MFGVRQLALALLTLSREGCRSLEGATAQHAIQWRRRRRRQEERRTQTHTKRQKKKKMDTKKKSKNAFKESLVRF